MQHKRDKCTIYLDHESHDFNIRLLNTAVFGTDFPNTYRFILLVESFKAKD